MRYIAPLSLASLLLTVGCPATSAPTGVSTPSNASDNPDEATYGAQGATAGSGSGPSSSPLKPRDQIEPERLVWAYIDGIRRAMDIDQARAYGFTIIDLSDDWVPYIFWSQTPGEEEYKRNAYAQRYVDLANDRIDVDGNPLANWDRNYLEVYGIPPTLTVLRQRIAEDEQSTCYDDLDLELFSEYYGPVRLSSRRGSLRLRSKYQAARAAYRKALRAARVRSLEQLLEKPRYAKVAEEYRRYDWRVRAVREMQKRIACENMYGKRKPKSVKPGIVNWDVRRALKRFERKHNIYGWGMINRSTAEALGRTPLQNSHESLKRMIIERVVSAAGILEDGSRRDEYRGADGSPHQVRNLVQEFGDATIQALGLTDPERSKAFLLQYEKEGYDRLFIAVQLPELPEYYKAHMEIEAQIHRGDVWYDLPFDEKGKRRGHPRGKLPSFTLYTDYNGQRIGLVRWRTTIGGWKKEKRGTEEYYKYKVSDVGPRVWRHIVAGPVWVPPRNTPSTDLVKFGVGGRIVGSSTLGPGFASAYGLVAAFHVRESDGHDNQIRTHGTVNYMSVKRGFSHGCHRLFNYRAVRLFSFVLRHRPFKRRGQSRLSYQHRFEHKGEEFQINLHTRGYYYQLTPPVKINVLEGRIRGKQKEPIDEYVKKPGQIYQDELPQHPSKGKPATGAPRTGTQQNNPLLQHQTL
jgi:hypothetical protein